MKKIIITVTGILLLASCTKNYMEYNTDPYLATLEQQEADNYISGKNFPAMINAVLPAGDPSGKTDYVNKYQVAFNLAGDVYSGYMGQAGDWGGNSNNLTYAFNTSWVNQQFALNSEMMSAWRDIKQVSEILGDSLQFSVAQIIKAVGTIKTTDSYGPIPSKSLATGSFTPTYESQDSIYYSTFNDLIRARDILHELGAAAGRPLQLYDLIYAGDFTKWAKFANSLILRYAIRIAYVEPNKAKQYAEEAISHPVGMISTNDEAALQSVKAGNIAFNYSNPLRTLTQDYKEARMGASMKSYLSGYKDPRIAVWFKTSSLANYNSEYLGIRAGINIVRSLYQPYSELNITDDTPMPWMRASEVLFLKAEAALRGWNAGGTDQQFYESGIRAAFAEAGVAMPDNYLNNNVLKPDNYIDVANPTYNINALSNITIKWDVASNFESKLERIITQKWLALYPNGQEAWAEFRRTGFPKLFPIGLNRGNIDIGKQVRRLPYPLEQYQKNAEQVAKAVTLLNGADNGGTRLWWDKKP